MKTENYEVPHNAVLYVPFLNFVSDKKILLSATLWNILSPCSCLRLTHQVSDACKTTGKTAVLYTYIYILIFRILLHFGNTNKIFRWIWPSETRSVKLVKLAKFVVLSIMAVLSVLLPVGQENGGHRLLGSERSRSRRWPPLPNLSPYWSPWSSYIEHSQFPVEQCPVLMPP